MNLRLASAVVDENDNNDDHSARCIEPGHQEVQPQAATEPVEKPGIIE